LNHFKVDKALVMGVETDLLFPIEQQKELADGLTAGGREVTFSRLPSLQGHDAFLVDMDRFRPVISDFLKNLG
jgi:homoserine O-acetyltransferase